MKPTVAVFRPDDERIDEAAEVLTTLGAEPVLDPMLSIERTGKTPRTDADTLVFTSPSAVDCLPPEWECDGVSVWAIGSKTASALESAGYVVDRIPETASSQGILEAYRDEVDGTQIEIARSAHGTDDLLAGLWKAGAYCHETVLYGLDRPAESGKSTELAAAGELDGALFTSSRTVEHFLEAAEGRGIATEAIDGLKEHTVVGAIGEPTRETAEGLEIPVTLVPEETSFTRLTREVIERIDG